MDKKLHAFYKIIEGMPNYAHSYMIELKTSKKISTAIVQATEIRAFLTHLAIDQEIFHISDLPLSSLSNLDSTFLDAYFLQVSVNSRITKISYLNMFFMYLVKKRLLHYNIFWDYSIPQGTPVNRSCVPYSIFKRTIIGIASGLNLSEREAKYAALTQLRDITIISLIYYAGISLSECAAVNISDIVIGDNTFESLVAAKKNCGKELNLTHLIHSWISSPTPFDSSIYNLFHKDGMLLLPNRHVYLEPRLCAFILCYLSEWENFVPGPLFYSLRRKRISERSIEHLITKHFLRYSATHVTAYELSISYNNSLTEKEPI